MKQTLLTNRYNIPILNKSLIHRMRNFIENITVVLFIGLSFCAKAQNPACTADVPYFLVDLSSSSAGSWSSPNIERNGSCCDDNNCVSFDVILNPLAAGIQISMVGADPAGSLFYDIGCVGDYPGGSVKCISGPGPHLITLCKPGGNSNVYIITSVSSPIFPPDDSARIGCSTQLTSLGVVSASTNWTSIYPGAQGDYNSFLSCTNCASPQYTPSASAPAYVDYQVCGAPEASNCGFAASVCDTVRIYNIPALSGSINPNPASFCDAGPGSGVTLTGNGIGGMPPYTYTWYNSSNVMVGTGSTYFVNQTGNITLEIHDAFYNATTCPAFFVSTSVIQNALPSVSAGTDQTVCATSPTVSLSGTITNSTGGLWSGGNGIFSPGNSFLNVNYTPSSAEIANGSVTLTLSANPSGGCPNVNDQVTIFFSDTIFVNVTGTSINCYGGTSTITATVSGGILPFTYLWDNGSTSTSINVGTGNYSIAVTDSIGCLGQQTYNVTSPSQLTMSLSSTDATMNGGSDGTASVIVSGGTPPYSYNWTPGNPIGEGTSTISNLSFGVYTVEVIDANGCTLSGSVVVNEPSCSGFSVSPLAINVSCNGANDGIAIGVVSGGVMPFTFTWNDPLSQTNDTAFNLAPGSYILNVVDSVNCVAATNIFFITEPDELNNSMSQTNVSLVGGNDGAATANITGGTSPYNYDWSPGNPSGDGTSTISGLNAGTYYVTITDANGCSVFDSVVITDPPCDALSINIVITDVSCYAGNTGSATANVAGATPPYTVAWSNGATGDTVNGLVAGNYSVIITDAVNCSQIIPFSIAQPELLSVVSSHTNVTCFGLNNGTVSINVNGGTYPYTFNWSNGSSNEDLINAGPGIYNITVTDANGCVDTSSETVIQPELLLAAIDITEPSCISASNGSIDLTVTGGTPGYSYSWSTGATTQDLAGIQAGGYSVLITDANGCITQPSPLFFAVTQPAELIANVVSTSDYNGFGVSCNDSTDGSVNIAVTGGTSPYTYLWSNNANTEDISGLGAGIYTLTVTDANGCTTQSIDVVITEPDLLMYTAISNNPGCNGIATGSINLSISGGVTPYVYSWNNGSSNEDLVNIGPGSYSVNVTDQNGCTTTLSSVISEPSPLTVIASISNITCMAGTNGAIDVTANGGTAPYTYLWSTGATTEDISGIPAGDYNVLVTDANGCTMIQPTLYFTLTQPDSLGVVSFTVDCPLPGTSTSLVTVVPSGGTGSVYQISFDNGATFQPAGIYYAYLPNGGTYNIIVRDNSGCSSLITDVIEVLPGLAITGIYFDECFSMGTTSTLVSVTAVGGDGGPYSISYDNGLTFQTAGTLSFNLPVGNSYSIIVRDGRGCQSAPVNIVIPSVLSANAQITSNYNGVNVSCFGAADGTATVNVTGGTTPYLYNWNSAPVQTSQTASGLIAGEIVITVTDANGCTSMDTLVLTEPAILTAVAGITSDYNGNNISCYGASDGSATVTMNGGTAPYNYNWSNSETTQSVTGLNASFYSVTVTDVNGCSAGASISLTQPAPFVMNIVNVSNYNGFGVSCFNSTDGSIDVAVTGGVAPFVYSWTNGMSTEDLSGLAAGTYSITVTDANGCLVMGDAEITAPAEMTNFLSATNAGCKGQASGSVDLTVSGGVIPYTFLWNNGASTEDISALTIGNYYVQITDLNGCIDTAFASVNEPEALVSVIQKQAPLCNSQDNGSIDIEVAGGTAPYSYNWSNGSTTEDLTGLAAGMYNVTIMDASGCQRTDMIEIEEPDSLSISLMSPELIDGFNISQYQGSDGSIILTVIGGTSEYNYMWSDYSTSPNIQNLTAGTYSVVCTDANGCKAIASISLNHPMVLEMPTGYTPNGDGNNDNFIVHGIEAYTNNVFTVFNRWGNIVYQKENYFNEWNGLNNKGEELPDGTYFVILEINDGGLVLKGYVEMKRY